MQTHLQSPCPCQRTFSHRNTSATNSLACQSALENTGAKASKTMRGDATFYFFQAPYDYIWSCSQAYATLSC